ncbi:class I SAM-dependent methyltransferase [Algoriphagus aquimarinus]|uniref:Class I SAM-dependent methyltransferase n=1 Tax=Algoriphagus aquimarinus TaxID=237018 RepID=A0A5C7AAC5_9BACT|nr:class I SAM-dependent methyltransferase [Algoriphagus aquimarinus]TXE02415.1 class I SAM-dependent methyltransferase [Algoriphagus aquimarinus]
MDDLRFGFGKNWLNYVKEVNEESIQAAKENIQLWVGNENLNDKRIIDIGCGSGIHSYAFFELGAKEVISFDYDINSVRAARILWEKSGKPKNWKIFQGSVLEIEFLKGLGQFDLVYSWGVLHHTGDLWKAISNTNYYLTNDDSIIWLALYQGVDTFQHDLKLKINYNTAGYLGKRFIVWKEIFRIMKRRRVKGKNPLTWNVKRGRGMSTYYDLIDWLGGYPYEVCTVDQLSNYMAKHGNWGLLKYNDDEACAVTIFKKNIDDVEPMYQTDKY